MKYKIGDRLKRKSDNTIIEISGFNGNIGEYISKFNGDYTQEYLDKNYELVQEYTFTSKFNIGDKVQSDNKLVLTVKRIEFGWEETMYVCYSKYDTPFALKENDLKLYEEPKVKEMTVEDIEKELGYTIKVVK